MESSAPVRPTPARALVTAQVDVGSSPTLIIAARDDRRAVLVVNHGTADVFIGDSTVSALTGLLLPGTKGAALSVPTDVAIYGIVASGIQRVSAAEIFGR